MHFYRLDQVVVEQGHHADDCCFADAVGRDARRPLQARNEDHLDDDLRVEDYSGVKVLLLEEMLGQTQHIDSQLVILLTVTASGDNF